ncbi:MAG: Rpn family recombination-promoting nuclease/putative transposase [Oscillospiraceae bacterium]
MKTKRVVSVEEEQMLYGTREEKLEIIKQFRLIDDTFMTKVFEDKACAELLLRVILNRDDLTVVKVVTQFEIKNLQGRSSRLDIYAVDKNGKHYNVEVQRDNDGAEPRRARYNSSLLDANALNAGEEVGALPETYVIFITEHDVLKGGKPIYTINRTIDELDKSIFGDGSHIIYVNAEIRSETMLGKLMQDFYCTDPHKMNHKALSERTKYFKETKEGFSTMCKLMEDYCAKYEKRGEARGNEMGEARGKEIGKEIEKKEIALTLWKRGMRDVDEISAITKLSVDEIKKLIEGEPA